MIIYVLAVIFVLVAFRKIALVRVFGTLSVMFLSLPSYLSYLVFEQKGIQKISWIDFSTNEGEVAVRHILAVIMWCSGVFVVMMAMGCFGYNFGN